MELLVSLVYNSRGSSCRGHENSGLRLLWSLAWPGTGPRGRPSGCPLAWDSGPFLAMLPRVMPGSWPH